MSKTIRSLFCLAALAAFAQSATAGTLTVTTLDDEFLTDGDCSLREAVYAANNNVSVDACGSGASGLDDILISAAGGSIQLTVPLVVEEALIIRGTGWYESRISGQDSTRVLQVDMSDNPSHDLTLEDLSIERGFSDDSDGGAGILATCVDVLRLDRVRVTDHTLRDAAGAAGAGISLAPEPGCDARLEVNTSYFSDNRAEMGVGGALYLSNAVGTVRSAEITATRFSDNRAAGDGGALYAYHVPTLSIEDAGFSGNRIDEEANPNARGGAIFLRSQEHESGSSLTLIERSGFSFNTAGTNGGAIGLDGPVVASIRNSTILNNRVAATGGEALDADGGSTVALFHTTLYDNGSGSSTDRALAARDSSQISINHTIIATSWSTTGNCDGDINSNGFNIDSGSSCTSEASDLPNTSPDLAAASTFSPPGLPFSYTILMPNPLSPVIDGGSGTYCPGPFGDETEVDQRGAPRPVSLPARGATPCDIGAIEFQPTDDPTVFRDRFED